MFVNEMRQGGIRALLDYDPTIFDDMQMLDDLDIQTAVDHILFKIGDAPLAVPDPAVMKYYIALWSARRLPLWKRYYDAATASYNPIENYDRKEKGTIKYILGSSREQQISADNVSTYQPDSKSIGSGTDTEDRDLTIHGNIGVTTSQQMLGSEFDIIPRLDTYEFIADDFHSEFCLRLYNY